MSSELLLKGFFVAIVSLMLSWVVFSRYDWEIGEENGESDRQRYLPAVPGNLLPFLLLTLTVLEILFEGVQAAAEMMLSMCFGIFLHISLYYALLMPLLPFLRKHISARACAMLWMLPNYLYLTYQEAMQVEVPLFVIRAPKGLVWFLFFVWFAGFFLVLARKIIAHLRFRSLILKNATEVTDLEMLALWNSEIAQAKIEHPKFKLIVSPNVTSPLSIGLFRRTIRVVLPCRTYTREELSLIFRHELVHIGREDAWAKFFLIFCTAMCWFNPLMWFAMRKSADDLELSCDETVLLNADDDTKRQYAHLILSTAGNEQGFTTCLSATAQALRYRLKSIMSPRKHHSGALIVGLVFFILCMSCGYVSLAYESNTGAEIIYQSRDTKLYTPEYIFMVDNSHNVSYKCTNVKAFHEYMASLTMDTLTGYYSFAEGEKYYSFAYQTPEGTLAVILSDKIIKLVPLYGKDPDVSYYYLPDGIDRDYLDSIIMPDP